MMTKAKWMLTALFLTGALMLTGCGGILPATASVYGLIEGVENPNLNFPQVSIICRGEAMTTVAKPGYHIPAPPCYSRPCFKKGRTVPSRVVEQFSEAKYASCLARHGWEFTHQVCVERCEHWEGQIMQQWFVDNSVPCADPAWERCERNDESGTRTVSCNFCESQMQL